MASSAPSVVKKGSANARAAAATAATAPELARARAGASFDVDQMRYLLHYGKANTEREEAIRSKVRDDPVYSKKGQHSMSRAERYKNMLRMVAHTHKREKELDLADDPMLRRWFTREIDQNLCTDLHTSMFNLTIQGQASAEQQAEWMPLVLSKGIIGTYAQTEMGHGSNLRRLETTAHFDEQTDEFVINTPTLTATKWWPGGLGKASTHAVLMARLVIKGKDYGQHAFMVQLRRQDNHMPLPGITVGDIGPKFAFIQQDNGFLAFDNVRIPRSAMLCRFAKVARDGSYSKPPHAKLKYGTMIAIRAGIIGAGASALSKAVTIAVRYSFVRCQFGSIDGTTNEYPVIKYQTQQFKLLPLLATAFAFHFTGSHMLRLYLKLKAGVDNEDFSVLPEVHASSSGLKAMVTSLCANGIERCRLACGGHGYSMFSGLPSLYGDYVAAVTYEGDNSLMLFQTARYLIKTVGQAATGGDIPSTLSHLTPAARAVLPHARCKAGSAEEMLDLDTLTALYRHWASRLAFTIADDFGANVASGMTQNDARSAIGQNLVRAATAHSFLTMMINFVQGVRKVRYPGLKPVLTRLCQLFGAYYAEENLGELMEDGYVSPVQATLLRRAVRLVMPTLVDDAVALVDAFGHSDHVLDSSLGRFDGDVYRDLWNRAQTSSLNKSQVVDGYEEYLKPLLQQSVWPDSLSFKSKL